jgi:hypothetical protein
MLLARSVEIDRADLFCPHTHVARDIYTHHPSLTHLDPLCLDPTQICNLLSRQIGLLLFVLRLCQASRKGIISTQNHLPSVKMYVLSDPPKDRNLLRRVLSGQNGSCSFYIRISPYYRTGKEDQRATPWTKAVVPSREAA